MNSNVIKHDSEDFQAAVRALSAEIARASALWSDKKYQELSLAVRGIAIMSKDVVKAGEAACSSIDRFEQISSEEY